MAGLSDVEALRQAVAEFLTLSDAEKIAIMEDPANYGLYNIISDMTLTYEDVEELVEADKYLGPQEEDEAVSAELRDMTWRFNRSTLEPLLTAGEDLVFSVLDGNSRGLNIPKLIYQLPQMKDSSTEINVLLPREKVLSGGECFVPLGEEPDSATYSENGDALWMIQAA